MPKREREDSKDSCSGDTSCSTDSSTSDSSSSCSIFSSSSGSAKRRSKKASFEVHKIDNGNSGDTTSKSNTSPRPNDGAVKLDVSATLRAELQPKLTETLGDHALEPVYGIKDENNGNSGRTGYEDGGGMQHEGYGNMSSDNDSPDDRFGTSASTSSTDADDEAVEDFRERLLAHAQVTSAAKKEHSTSIESEGLLGSGLNPARALEHLRKALLKPVSSTALAVVSATDESHDLMDAVVSAKLPPPPADDVKRLRKLHYVDHSTIEYPPIQKEFYVSPPDVRGLDAGELKELLKELDGAKVRGRDPPRPMRSWTGSGLADSVLEALAEGGFQQPFAVQSLGAPVLMSGRDLLVVAKTGSGKTLSYLLPLIRHCMGQRACKKGEGPITLVLVPTHELGCQIVRVAEKLCSAAHLRLVASYGLVPLSDNIKQCRAGCEVMVSTPGRLLDLLTVGGGGVLSLRFVSFVVVDEADRMFDSGFAEHVEAFLKNIRPDRQLAMFSATMPKELKKVICRHLHDPIEITVGGKPTPACNVEQRFFFFDEELYDVDVESRSEDKKFLKLLQILGEEGGNGEHLILIFTQQKKECDELFARLSACGYNKRIAVLYSGMDPIDREFALEYFSPGNQFILIATGVAERGLDIPYLELVINYTLPDHYEAYVHRIGRTGRAGRKGKAVSFFTRGKDDELAADLCEGLERAEQQVSEELYERATKVRELRKGGTARHNALFHRGYMRAKKQRFTNRDQKEQFKTALRAAGLEDDMPTGSDSDSGFSSGDDSDVGVKIKAVEEDNADDSCDAELSSALTIHKGDGALTVSSAQLQKQKESLEAALAYARKTTEMAVNPASRNVRFEAEYPINDLPNVVRLRLQNSAVLRSVAEESNSTIVRKGVFYDKSLKHSHRLRDGVRPLYLLIIGKTAESVRDTVKKLNSVKEEAQSRLQQKVSSVGAQL